MLALGNDTMGTLAINALYFYHREIPANEQADIDAHIEKLVDGLDLYESENMRFTNLTEGEVERALEILNHTSN